MFVEMKVVRVSKQRWVHGKARQRKHGGKKPYDWLLCLFLHVLIHLVWCHDNLHVSLRAIHTRSYPSL